MQTNTEHDEDLLENISVYNVKKIELIDKKCAKYTEKFVCKLAAKQQTAQSESHSTSHNASACNCIRCKHGCHVHSELYARGQQNQPNATGIGI